MATTNTTINGEVNNPTPTVTAPDPSPAPAEVASAQPVESQSEGTPSGPMPAQVPSTGPAPLPESTPAPLTEPQHSAEAASTTPVPTGNITTPPEAVADSDHNKADVTPAPVAQPPEQASTTSAPQPQAAMTETTAAAPVTAPTEGAIQPTEAKDAKKVDFAEVEEPQNPLTERFTSAEWKALKEFRPNLPKIFELAYPEDPKASGKSVKLWGIEIFPQEAEAPKDARVSVILMKFLRARNLNPSAAQDMMVATLRWRDLFGVEAALKETFPEEVFGQLGHVYGKDKEGRPVVYNLYGANKDLKAVFGDVQRFLRWRVKLMEESLSHLDFVNIDQTVQIHDYEGVSLSSRDANSKQAASEASSIFQSHYPELLHRKFFVNVPSLLNWIFWLFKPLISANTLAKMSVVGSGPHTIGKSLLPVINKEELPKRYGGEAEAF